jgi:intergrase/recombinase
MKPRHDHETAKLIDASVDVLESDGIYLATRMLCERGVRLETTLRVLSQPDQRRTCITAIIG